jgi:hypothetical protein
MNTTRAFFVVLLAGATAGAKVAGESLRGEFSDTAYALRSLDQSYEICEQRGCGCWTAGSFFHQRPVEESLSELRALERKQELEQKKEEEKKKKEAPPEIKPRKKQLKPKQKPETDEEAAETIRFELTSPARTGEI